MQGQGELCNISATEACYSQRTSTLVALDFWSGAVCSKLPSMGSTLQPFFVVQSHLALPMHHLFLNDAQLELWSTATGLCIVTWPYTATWLYIVTWPCIVMRPYIATWHCIVMWPYIVIWPAQTLPAPLFDNPPPNPHLPRSKHIEQRQVQARCNESLPRNDAPNISFAHC
eukprot:1158656-Pelagomonas_calceolata.AAC.15